MENELPKHYIAGGVYAKEWRGQAGQRIEQHSHNFDHLSYLAKGRVLVEVEGSTNLTVEGPTALRIAAHKFHKITALTDCLWLCIHAIPEDLKDESSIETYLVDEEA